VFASNFGNGILALEDLADLAAVDHALRDLEAGTEVVYQLSLLWNILKDDGTPDVYRQTFWQ